MSAWCAPWTAWNVLKDKDNYAPDLVLAKMDSPTFAAEKFFQCIKAERYEEAADLLSREDKRNFRKLSLHLQNQKGASPYNLAAYIEDTFFLVHGQKNMKMVKKTVMAGSFCRKK